MLLPLHITAKLVGIENQIRRDEGILLATRLLELAKEIGLSPEQTESLVNLFLNRNNELEE